MSSGPNESVPRVPATPQQEAPLPGAVEPSSPVVINWGMYPDIFLVQPHEPLEYYVPGGFHPVSLGDTLRDGQYTIRYKNEEVRFIDWGLSYPVGESVTVLEQPDSLRPPETFFGHTFTYKHDLWRAGSVIYSLFYQKPPFSCIGDPKHFFIRRLVAKLGPLPPIWNAEWEEMMVGDKHAEVDAANMPQELLQDTFEPRRQEIVRQWHTDLQGYELDEHFGYDLETLKCLLRPIQGLMQHEPEKRISLQEAMSCIEWTDYRKQGSFTSEDEDEE
ncbi:hypothetical protein SEUCBS140593_007006 [Sporothrix eucalyptigena]|uniref:Protein kinase domain-containing protein n=1 Tax=Sporothrix eucalyptigena TaxID=1812306 RepID=A0ABP0C9L8_9PEZI